MPHPARPTGPVYDLPTPAVAIGTKLEPAAVQGDGYLRRQIIRHEVRETLRSLASLRRQGFAERKPGETIIPPYNKDCLRKIIRIIDEAYEVEVAGLVARNHHNGAIHQSYVGGLPRAHGGVEHAVQLLYRAEIDGVHLAYLAPPLRYGITAYKAGRMVEDGSTPHDRGRMALHEGGAALPNLYREGTPEAEQYNLGVEAEKVSRHERRDAQLNAAMAAFMEERRAAVTRNRGIAPGTRVRYSRHYLDVHSVPEGDKRAERRGTALSVKHYAAAGGPAEEHDPNGCTIVEVRWDDDPHSSPGVNFLNLLTATK